MKKNILVLAIVLSLMSCSDKNIDLIKSDLKASDKLTNAEIESTQFKTTKMIDSDGKTSLITYNSDRQYIISQKGGLYASNFDFANPQSIVENTDVFFIEAYRFTTDTVFKKVYYINENKIVGKFILK